MENHSIVFQRVIKHIRKFTNPYGERIQYVWGTNPIHMGMNPNHMGMNPKTLHKKTDPVAEDVIAAESGFRSVRLTDTRS